MADTPVPTKITLNVNNPENIVNEAQFNTPV